MSIRETILFRWPINQGLIQNLEWLFVSYFWFYMNLSIRCELFLLSAFVEFIFFEETSWKNYFVVKRHLYWYFYLLLKIGIWLFVCRLFILLLIYKWRFCYLSLCKCSGSFIILSQFLYAAKWFKEGRR